MSETGVRASVALRIILLNVLLRLSDDGAFFLNINMNNQAFFDQVGNVPKPGVFEDPAFRAFQAFIEKHTQHRLVVDQVHDYGHAGHAALVPKAWGR